MVEPENDKERRERKLRELEGKNVAHYSVMLSAWIESRMARDKALMTLSAAGVGLIVTILTTVGIKSWIDLALVALSLLGFGSCIWAALRIYQLNTEHIEELIGETQGSEKRVVLEKFDKMSERSFYAGAIFIVLFGISQASVTMRIEDEKMADQDSRVVKQGEILKKSISGIGGLAPKAPEGDSDSSSGQSPSGSGNSGGEGEAED
ncbi:hypothetical protein [Solemya velum gill symbiont]|uniref:hypothetical protein n=1 Tax=Solemya velum gill symbiont TaxID=2340 RepID=UPI000998A478|nr:hypothetical protein [Solemya velum gill symbiont]OOZ44258.1 hypothetical protein BOW37_07715 [Solemya velum gill symbiont]OOZ48023.1 hypothetical protein BOW38_00740 [Solemya velum gill symbiont]OOZ51042.1 hypothetical protein BOW39_00005 [Solemya velum gill symbiont]OOZ52965.1 hypothetical protein BOW40_00740 [Solemya velum gill symbiont]OOZ55602.1 hypothetical protein BOW42_09540 [Solemya velum gill symbiont]